MRQASVVSSINTQNNNNLCDQSYIPHADDYFAKAHEMKKLEKIIID